MARARLLTIIGAVSTLSLLLAVAHIGLSGVRPGTSIELAEDGEWYYGTFIPQLDYSPERRAALKEAEQKQAAAKNAAEAASSKANNALSAKQLTKEHLDLNLKALELQAKELGINIGTDSTKPKLDDLPIPNIEPGTDNTPEIPFPDARHPRRKSMLAKTEASQDDDWDHSGKLEKAGVNVHSGFGEPVVADHSIPVAKIDNEHKEMVGEAVETFDEDVKEDRSSEEQIAAEKAAAEEQKKQQEEADKAAAEKAAAEKAAAEAAAAEAEAAAAAAAATPADDNNGADEALPTPPVSPTGHLGLGGEDKKVDVTQPASEEGEAPPAPLHHIGLRARTGALFEVARQGSQLYADATSPDYLEPQKHQKSYNAAWKWASTLRAHRGQQDVDATAQPDVAAENKAKQGATGGSKTGGQKQKLAMVNDKVDKPKVHCPWYGCADGSHADFGTQMKGASKQQKLATTVPAAPAKAAAAAGTVAKGGAKQSLHLAHGYGTTNAYTAKPLHAPKNQYYGGDHTFYGSERPVTSQGGVVNGKQAYANDMQPAYDLDAPTSFDSVPLAESSSFLSAVAKHQPQGDGELNYNEYRSQVLSGWRLYEHGLSKCMQAEATLDPTLKDYSCNDVHVGLDYLKDCMRNHKFGLSKLEQTSTSYNSQGNRYAFFGPGSGDAHGEHSKGSWGVLPVLLAKSHKLDPEDYRTVYGVLTRNAVFSALWRMENLYTRCATTGSAYKPEGLTREKEIQSIDKEIYNLDRSIKHDMPGTAEMQDAEDRIQGKYAGWPSEYSAVQRGAARNYWTHVANTWPSSTEPNLPEGEYYGEDNGWQPALLGEHKVARKDLPHWRVPMADEQPNPAGPTGTYGDYIMQQPRARLSPDVAQPAQFPVRVNGQHVDPVRSRPFEVTNGALTGYRQHYTWVGPGQYDYVPLASPDALRAGYNHPTTVWPTLAPQCVEDRQCGARSVCGSAGLCVEWDSENEPYRVAAQGGSWPTHASADWV